MACLGSMSFALALSRREILLRRLLLYLVLVAWDQPPLGFWPLG